MSKKLRKGASDMEIDNGKVRKLEMDELEQVSGGRITDFLNEGRLSAIFGSNETQTTENTPQQNVQYKPPVLKA